MLLSILVAVAENGVIGAGNRLPWRLPADLQRFKELTMGKPIMMGRKTYESIGRPLPGRKNIVVTRQPALRLEGCTVVESLDAALIAAGAAPEVAVIGGAELYRLALPLVQMIHLTRVHARVSGDVLFPPIDSDDWREVTLSRHPADDRHAFAFSFLQLTRVRDAQRGG
jgi:dihydrofolate reductase